MPSSIHRYAMAGQPDEVLRLLAKGTDVSGRTALIAAAFRGRSGVAALLLRHGACMSSADDQSRAAYTLATQQGHDEVAKLLRAASYRHP